MKKIVVALVLAGFFTGMVLSSGAAARDLAGEESVYWSRQDVDTLFSQDLMRSLDLSRSQRSALDELLYRDWGYRRDNRGLGGLEAILGPGRMGNGSRIGIERGNDNLQTFLTLLTLGIIISQTQDDDPYYDNYIRIDDFLYYFFRILDMNQRTVFRVYFNNWYDNRYYYRDQDRYRWEIPRELERRLRLSKRQRLDIERSLRDLYERQWKLEKRYRDMERDYLQRNWDRSSSREIDGFRRRLFDARRQILTPQQEARERFRSALDDRQRRDFDAMLPAMQPSAHHSHPQQQQIQQQPKFQSKPQPPVYQQSKPQPPKLKPKPQQPEYQQPKPQPPKLKPKPQPPVYQQPNQQPPKLKPKPQPPVYQQPNQQPPKLKQKPFEKDPGK